MSSTGVGDRSFRFDATPHGKPAVESALLRWITSIPSLLILGALAAVGYVIWIITSVVILIQED
jgi:hypothetical protein